MAEEPRRRREAGVSRVPEGQPHVDAEAVRRSVERHLKAPFRRPCDTPGIQRIRAQLREMELLPESPDTKVSWDGWLLDAGCGDASSSRRRMAENPGLKVLAIDKSAQRLLRGQRRFDEDGSPTGLYVLQADVVDFFVLAAAEGWVFPKLLLCHPNPWPKARHRGRRWYGHPVWPLMLACAQALEVRSNWSIYTRELAVALELASGRQPQLRQLGEEEASLSTFKHKYRESGHTIEICELSGEGPLLVAT